MKKILITALLAIGLASITFAQKNSYGLSIGLGGGMIMKEALDGDASYDLKTGVSVGLQYSRKFSERLELMTGLHWYNNTVSVTPSFHPDIDMTPTNHDVQLIYIPVFLKVNLAKYFFIDGGLIADFDITKDKYITSQSGMGAGFGIGTEFLIKEKFVVQLNPYLNFHGLLLSDNADMYPEKVLDSGIKLSFLILK